MTQAMHQILIIEDDASIRGVLRVLLHAEHYRVIEAETAARAEIEARSHKPDLLLVDLGLPDGDGLKVVQSIRTWSPVPIVVLSARTMETQKIAALDAGADDFVAKPFSAPELLARVRAALRRSARGSEQPPVLQLGEISVDLVAATDPSARCRGSSHAARIPSTGGPGASGRPDRDGQPAHQGGLGSRSNR